MTTREPTRRRVLEGSALLGLGLWAGARPGRSRGSANERLDIGVVGVANRGAANLDEVAGENVVALCDVDLRYLARAGERFPSAALYTDWRRMLDEQRLDAVVISTPDHTHAPPTAAALRAGLHVYCEKPLTRTVHEARVVTELARERGAVTQMGIQIHALDNYRRVVELVRSGAIGAVSEVHVFCDKSWSATALPRGGAPVPAHLRYDLWLGPSPAVPYDPAYLPGDWRRYWAFGGGTLADMACHYVDLAFWALGLDRPTRVEASGPEPVAGCAPPWLVARYEFPARGTRPAVTLTWSDGGRAPVLLDELGTADWRNGVLFVGSDGALLADYTRRRLLPDERFADFVAPEPTIPASIGHHREWIEACKGRGTTTCGFDYSGPLTECVLLGGVAYRAGRPLAWDGAALAATGDAAADAWIRPRYRAGWTL